MSDERAEILREMAVTLYYHEGEYKRSLDALRRASFNHPDAADVYHEGFLQLTEEYEQLKSSVMTLCEDKLRALPLPRLELPPIPEIENRLRSVFFRHATLKPEQLKINLPYPVIV